MSAHDIMSLHWVQVQLTVEYHILVSSQTLELFAQMCTKMYKMSFFFSRFQTPLERQQKCSIDIQVDKHSALRNNLGNHNSLLGLTSPRELHRMGHPSSWSQLTSFEDNFPDTPTVIINQSKTTESSNQSKIY